MKFSCGTTPAQRILARIRYLERWHPYFAWLPVHLEDGTCVWLERVERRCVWSGHWGGGDWESYYHLGEDKP